MSKKAMGEVIIKAMPLSMTDDFEGWRSVNGWVTREWEGTNVSKRVVLEVLSHYGGWTNDPHLEKKADKRYSQLVKLYKKKNRDFEDDEPQNNGDSDGTGSPRPSDAPKEKKHVDNPFRLSKKSEVQNDGETGEREAPE